MNIAQSTPSARVFELSPSFSSVRDATPARRRVMGGKSLWALLVASAIALSASSASALTWVNLGGNMQSVPPALTLRAPPSSPPMPDPPGLVDLYAVDTSYAVQVNTITSDGQVNGWTNLGGVVLYLPSAIADGQHREVFAIGTDHALYHNWSDDSLTWSGWSSLGVPSGVTFCSSPTALLHLASQILIEVVVLGCDQALYDLRFDGTNWGDWTQASTGPWAFEIDTADLRFNGDIDIFAVQNDGTLWDVARRGSSWQTASTGAAGGLFVTAGPLRIPRNPNYVVITHTPGTPFFTAAQSSDGVNWTAPVNSNVVNNSFAFPRMVAYSIANHTEDDRGRVYYLEQDGTPYSQLYSPGTNAPGTWTQPLHLSTNDVFAGGLTGIAAGNLMGTFVFAIKSDGQVWYAPDPS